MTRHYQHLHPIIQFIMLHLREILFFATARGKLSFTWSMVISISSTSTVAESSVMTASTTPIMEDTVGYVPSQAMATKEVEQVPFFPTVRLRLDPPGSFGITMRKCFGS